MCGIEHSTQTIQHIELIYIYILIPTSKPTGLCGLEVMTLALKARDCRFESRQIPFILSTKKELFIEGLCLIWNHSTSFVPVWALLLFIWWFIYYLLSTVIIISCIYIYWLYINNNISKYTYSSDTVDHHLHRRAKCRAASLRNGRRTPGYWWGTQRSKKEFGSFQVECICFLG